MVSNGEITVGMVNSQCLIYGSNVVLIMQIRNHITCVQANHSSGPKQTDLVVDIILSSHYFLYLID